jgi:hypothetical protein
MEKKLPQGIDVLAKVLNLPASNPITNKDKTMDKELLSAIGLDATATVAQAVEKINELKGLKAQVTSLTEALTQKGEIVTGLQSELATAKTTITELQKASQTHLVTAKRMELCQELGVTLSDDGVKALERRIGTMFGISDATAKADMESDIKLWIGQHGVKASGSGLEKPADRKPAADKASDYQERVHAKITELRKADDKLTFDQAYAKAVAMVPDAKADAGDDD